jgi:hypothetical protein
MATSTLASDESRRLCYKLLEDEQVTGWRFEDGWKLLGNLSSTPTLSGTPTPSRPGLDALLAVAVREGGRLVTVPVWWPGREDFDFGGQ